MNERASKRERRMKSDAISKNRIERKIHSECSEIELRKKDISNRKFRSTKLRKAKKSSTVYI